MIYDETANNNAGAYVLCTNGAYNIVSLKLYCNSGAGSIPYLAIGQNSANTSYPLYVKGSSRIDGCIHVFSVGGNYADGIRIHARSSDSNWAGILLCGSDNTGDTGTSATSWYIGNNKGTLYINLNKSSDAGNPRAMATSTGWTFGNTTTNSYALNAASFICDSWVRTKGATGWYNEDYKGGWYMPDATYVKLYGNK